MLVNDAKKRIVEKTLEITDGNFQEAADLLGITVAYLYRLHHAFFEKRDTDPPQPPLA